MRDAIDEYRESADDLRGEIARLEERRTALARWMAENRAENDVAERISELEGQLVEVDRALGESREVLGQMRDALIRAVDVAERRHAERNAIVDAVVEEIDRRDTTSGTRKRLTRLIDEVMLEGDEAG